MFESYQNIPLQFLLKKEDFEKAKGIYINAFAVDLHFAETYLSSLREDARLFIRAERVEENVLEFFKYKLNCPFYHFVPTGKRILGVKDLLLDLEDYRLTTLTISNFTILGLEDELAHHKISTKSSTYELFQRQHRRHFPDAFN